jgi:hypothetical protein
MPHQTVTVPPGECRQCWTHAYDRTIHAHLKWNENCQACLSHLQSNGGCPPEQIVPGKRSWI